MSLGGILGPGFPGGLEALSRQDYERRMHEQRMMAMMQQSAQMQMSPFQASALAQATQNQPAPPVTWVAEPKKPKYLNPKLLLIRRRK